MTRILSMEDRILNLLMERGIDGAYNYELSRISLNYTGIISTLYRKGHIIQCKQMSEGTYLYILRKRTAKIKYHPSAWEDAILHFHISFNGSLNSEEEFVALFHMVGSNITRKHGYYKDQMKSEYQQFEEEQMRLFDLD